MNKRLLFITHHRLCDNNGGCNGSKGFLHSFVALFDDCSIICPSFEGPTEPYIPKQVKIHFIDNNRSNLHKLFDMYRGIISPIYYAVKEHLRTNRYDVIVIDHSFSGAGIISMCKATGAKVITIHHNVERDYLRDNSKERPLFYRYPFLYYSKRAEQQCLKNSDINLTLTEKDSENFRTWYPDIKLYKWGVFEYQPIAGKTFSERERQHIFSITGSLCFEQSLLPILEFVKKYLPLLHKEYPQAKLIIAGRNPDKRLRDINSAENGITVIPNPDDMAKVIRQSDYYICPINAGSGLKLRIMDGLRQGLPILCHEVASSGYETIQENGCLFTYHNEETFILSLRKMLTAKPTPNKVYQSYKDTFSLQSGINRLQEVLTKEHIL